MYKTFFTLLASLYLLAPSIALAETNENPLSWYGDFRLRLEQDWDSKTSDGTPREDRLRARVRLRVGLNYRPTDYLDLGLRLRSGTEDGQQIPHITIIDFDDNDTGDADFNFDKWYLKAGDKDLWGWAGRNNLPIWKAHDLFWTDDVTVAGVAGGLERASGDNTRLGLNAGYYSLPAGMRGFCGNMGHVQGVMHTKAGNAGLTFAGGVLDIDAGSDGDEDCDLFLQNNGERDYTLWVASVQSRIGRFRFGADYSHNSQNYEIGEPGITATNQDETDGWVAYVRHGDMDERGNWLLGWWYVRIEQFAVNNSFAEADWVRWGSATQTRASDMKGHEFKIGYGLGNGMNVLLRMYFADAITSVEDGNRARLDFNYRFK